MLAEIGSTGSRLDRLTDGLGSVRGLTDATGVVTATITFSAYGAVRPSTRTQSEFGFTGEQKDGVTNYTYLRARYLDTKLGRFTQRDTASRTRMEHRGSMPIVMLPISHVPLPIPVGMITVAQDSM